MKIAEARTALNSKTKKVTEILSKLKTPGIGWEIGAYGIRIVSVTVPAAVIMTLEDSWLKSSIGLMATFLIVAILFIMSEPIKKASNFAPGVLVFAIFIAIAVLFQTVSDVLLTIGISGLAGCIAAIPLHCKYLSRQEEQKSPELQALEKIANNIEKLK